MTRTGRDPIAPAVAGGRPLAATLDVERDLLTTLAEAINSELDLSRVLQTVTDIGTEVSGAQFGAFFYNERDEQGQLYQLHILSGAGLDTFATMPAPRITALFEPTFTGVSSVRIDDVTQDARFSGMPPGHLPVRSYLAVPVVTRTGEVIGALLFGHAQPARFDERCERVLYSIAAQAAVAVENARLFAAEQAARLRAEQATARLATLQALTARLSAAMTTTDALEAVGRALAEPLEAARVGLFLRVEGGFRSVATTDPGCAAGGPSLALVPDTLPNPLADAARLGRPLAICGPSEFARGYPELFGELPVPHAASVVLPLVAGDRVLGACAMSWDVERRLDDAELEMLATAGIQLTTTVERALLVEAERAAGRALAASIDAATATSRTLQRSLLPRTVPDIDGVRVAVRYQPSSVEAEVGGDWYDVIRTDEGAILVIGDVQGHNLSAAALMGQLRIGLHAYLAEGHPIDSAIARANSLLGELSPSMIATCCVVRVDLVRSEMSVVRAGHLAPLLRRDGRVREIDCRPGVPLGVLRRGGRWPVTTVPLEAGDRLVLFTDGLVERRDSDLADGIAALCGELERAGGTHPERVVRSVVSALCSEQDDDVAVLVADIGEPPPVDDVATSDVPAAADPVAHGLRFARHALRAWGLDARQDAAADAVRGLLADLQPGAHGVLSLQVRRRGDDLRVTVTDRGSRRSETVRVAA